MTVVGVERKIGCGVVGFLFGPIDSWDFGVSCVGCLVGSWWRLGPKVVLR